MREEQKIKQEIGEAVLARLEAVVERAENAEEAETLEWNRANRARNRVEQLERALEGLIEHDHIIGDRPERIWLHGTEAETAGAIYDLLHPPK